MDIADPKTLFKGLLSPPEVGGELVPIASWVNLIA